MKPDDLIDTAALFVAASHLSDNGRHKAAFKLLKKAADLGDSSVHLNIGYCYDVGQGVRRDRSKAFLWYRRAWKRGEGSAANNIGTIYRDIGNRRMAIAWFRRAITRGSAGSAIELAKLKLKTGNRAEAIRLLRCALRHRNLMCEANEEIAQHMLSSMSTATPATPTK